MMSKVCVLFVIIFDMSSSFSNTISPNDNPTTSSSYAPVWSYDDESNWPGNKCREGGKRQSPIDIRTVDVIKDFNKDFIKYGPLQFIGYHQVLVTGINNGHTVQFSTEGAPDMHPMLTGGPLKYNYRLEQLHFHWLSEHSVNGIKFPMEIHFVHVRSDLPVHEALKKRDGLAIVAVFCNVQADMDEDQVEVTEEIMQHIPDLMETGDRISGIVLDMTKLLSPNLDYYTYAGSLTSPQCNEAVIWIIFTTPISMSDAQRSFESELLRLSSERLKSQHLLRMPCAMAKHVSRKSDTERKKNNKYRLFGKIGVGRHNFRSLQHINKHQVFTPPYTALHTPQMIIFLEKMAKLVTDFFRNISSFISKGLKSR